MKLRVVRADGRPAGMREIAVRTILRVIDGIGMYIVGLIVMLVTGERRQRIGDLAARPRSWSTRPVRRPPWRSPPRRRPSATSSRTRSRSRTVEVEDVAGRGAGRRAGRESPTPPGRSRCPRARRRPRPLSDLVGAARRRPPRRRSRRPRSSRPSRSLERAGGRVVEAEPVAETSRRPSPSRSSRSRWSPSTSSRSSSSPWCRGAGRRGRGARRRRSTSRSSRSGAGGRGGASAGHVALARGACGRCGRRPGGSGQDEDADAR